MRREWSERFDACFVIGSAVAALGVTLSALIVTLGGALRVAGLI